MERELVTETKEIVQPTLTYTYGYVLEVSTLIRLLEALNDSGHKYLEFVQNDGYDFIHLMFSNKPDDERI